MYGKHCLKTWSITQQSVALSSAEAEFYAAVEATQRGLGMKSIMAELGKEVGLEVYMDASAAKSFASRRGLGKMRHVDTKHLWLQRMVKDKNLVLKKIAGTSNPADILTKYHSIGELESWCSSLSIAFCKRSDDAVEK